MSISGQFRLKQYGDTFYGSGTMSEDGTGRSQTFGDFDHPEKGGVQVQVLRQNKSIEMSAAHHAGGKGRMKVPVHHAADNPKYAQVMGVLSQAVAQGKVVEIVSDQDLSLRGPGGIVIEDAYIRG